MIWSWTQANKSVLAAPTCSLGAGPYVRAGVQVHCVNATRQDQEVSVEVSVFLLAAGPPCLLSVSPVWQAELLCMIRRQYIGFGLFQPVVPGEQCRGCTSRSPLLSQAELPGSSQQAYAAA